MRAGFAANTVSSPVKGLMPLRALVAGFLTDLILHRPKTLNKPEPRGLSYFAISSSNDVKTAATCLRVSSVSVAIAFRISDFVGAFFTAGAAFFLTAMLFRSSNVRVLN